MTQHPDDRTQGEPTDPEADERWPDDAVDLHPAIDHRDSEEAGQPPAPPPLDVDDRQGARHSQTAPDVIELAEHGPDPGETPIADVDSPEGERVADVDLPADLTSEGPESEQRPAPSGEDDAQDTAVDGQPVQAEPPRGSSEPGERVVMFTRTNEGGAPPDGEPDEPSESIPSKASSRLAGVASRLGFGKDPEGAGQDAGVQPSSEPRRSGARVADGIRAYLDPRLHMFSTIPHRRVVATGLLLILASLLANSGGVALIVLSAIIPILIVITLTQHDVFEKESNLLIMAVGAAGAVIGIVLSTISAWILSSQWFDTGVLNYGAAGFGGRFADAAGVSIGASIVHWWPMVADSGPQTNVSDWTLSIIGVAILRASVIALCGAMIGAGIWRYMITPTASVIVLPAVSGAVGYVLLTFGSVQLQAAGSWPELLWIAALLVAVFVVYRRVLDQAVETDRRALGSDQGRMVCPSCHKVTPAGAFCARCGQPLNRGDTETTRNEPLAGDDERSVPTSS